MIWALHASITRHGTFREHDGSSASLTCPSCMRCYGAAGSRLCADRCMWFNYHHGAILGVLAARLTTTAHTTTPTRMALLEPAGLVRPIADTHPCGTAHLDTSARARHLYSAAHCTLTSDTRVPPIAGPDPMGSGTAADTSVQRRPPQCRAQPPSSARPILPNTQCRGTFPLTATLGAPSSRDYRLTARSYCPTGVSIPQWIPACSLDGCHGW